MPLPALVVCVGLVEEDFGDQKQRLEVQLVCGIIIRKHEFGFEFARGDDDADYARADGLHHDVLGAFPGKVPVVLVIFCWRCHVNLLV